MSDEEQLEEIVQQEPERAEQQQQPPTKTELKISGGAGFVGTTLVLGYVAWDKFRRIFYPVKPKKIAHIALAVGLAWGVFHPASTVKFIGNTADKGYHWVEGLVTRREAANDAIEKTKGLEQEVTDYQQKELQMQKRIEEVTGQKVEFKSRYEKVLTDSKQKDKTISQLINDKKSLESELNKKKVTEEYLATHPVVDQTILPKNMVEEPDKPIGGRPEDARLVAHYESRTPVVFVQRKGTTLAEIARQYTGDGSNWRQLARYNKKEVSGNTVIIYMGEKIAIPTQYVDSSSELRWMSKEEMPRTYFKRERGESIEDAMVRNLGNLRREREILDYNRKLMPSISLEQQEIFWVPDRR
ncbi:LysM peptidoglycan-binding domain-containing protein [Candidatus Woesearchaeota archaeon]|nr:LysM peptidoglycan-binding domain-containing protein [Candidatus Woesearchaeota archaeon]